VEFHGAGEWDFDHFTLRRLAEMNCCLHIKHCP
jgi:hypothetical protein